MTDDTYVQPWANPGFIENGPTHLVYARRRRCEPCEFTWVGELPCELCGGPQ